VRRAAACGRASATPQPRISPCAAPPRAGGRAPRVRACAAASALRPEVLPCSSDGRPGFSLAGRGGPARAPPCRRISGRSPPRGATTAAAGSAQGLRRRRWVRATRGASNASQRSSHGRPRAPRRSPRHTAASSFVAAMAHPSSLPPPSGRVLALLLHGRPQARRWSCPAAAFSSLGTATLGGEASRGRRRVGSRRPRRPFPCSLSCRPPPSAQRLPHWKFAGEQLPAGVGFRGGERLHPAVGDFFSFFLIFMK